MARVLTRYLLRHPKDVHSALHVGRLFLYAQWIDDGLKAIERVCHDHPAIALDDPTLVALTFAYRTSARSRARRLIDAHAKERAATVLLVGANIVSRRSQRRHLIADARARGAAKKPTAARLLLFAEAHSCTARRKALAELAPSTADPAVRIMLVLLERDRCLGPAAQLLLRGP